jgi:hypothetical protein
MVNGYLGGYRPTNGWSAVGHEKTVDGEPGCLRQLILPVDPGKSAAAELNGWTIVLKRGSVEIPMKRELKPTEHEAVLHAVRAGDRVKATSLYLSATEGNLTDAQNFVKSLAVEIKDPRTGGGAPPSK